ncbi:hypothetical protein [Paenibacillus sinopodophylli]|uniref:hypothetical protein n=1 Tax=Paenibacillus sinopodophylli TaxID=1837342 RepID=UPI00110CA77D|nr:hypothetical protein [Paenibacillus sinopodophylli]
MDTPTQTEVSYSLTIKEELFITPETSNELPQELQKVWHKLAFWMRTTAVFTLLFGLFQTFIGIINFGWGTLAGILELVMTIVLLIMASQAKKLQANPRDELTAAKLANRLLLYFRLQSAFVIVFSFVIIMLVITILQFITDWDWLIHLVKEGKKADKLLIKVQGWYETIVVWISKIND